METNKIYCGDASLILKSIPSKSIDTVVTSPPYYKLRDYGVYGQIGNEVTPEEYIDNLSKVFVEILRVLKDLGACWINIGELSPDNMIPERLCLRMKEDGWIRIDTIIWFKRRIFPKPHKRKFTIDFEYLYLFVKNNDYYFEQQYDPISEFTRKRSKYGGYDTSGKHSRRLTHCYGDKADAYMRKIVNGEKSHRIKRCVWQVPTFTYSCNHTAVFPEKLCETPILATCPPNGIVLDPFMGSGTVAVVANNLSRQWIGIELNQEYIKIAQERIKQESQQLVLNI